MIGPLDPFGYKAQLAKILARLDDLQKHADKPGWLTQTPPVKTAQEAVTSTTYPIPPIPPQPPTYGVVVDTVGLVYALLYAILGMCQQIQVSLATLDQKASKIMATEADIQAAADAITASMKQLQDSVASEDAAIAAILQWVQNHPNTVPDALVQQLQNAQTVAQQVVTDVNTQTQNLTSGTPTA